VNDQAASRKRLKRAAVKRLVEDGVLLALAQRAALRGALFHQVEPQQRSTSMLSGFR
jgi:hypothetical protein